MYAFVPTQLLQRLFSPCPVESMQCALPKSVSSTRGKLDVLSLSRMFSGLMSRWLMPRECRYCADKGELRMTQTRGGGGKVSSLTARA